MASSQQPDAPPPYSRTDPVAGSSSAGPSSRLQVPERNGIPAAARRSMEDESRPLPEGWVRQFDSKNSHQFYVDIRSEPPRSTWHHPYDDEEYLSTLPSAERERIQELTRHPSHHDLLSGYSSNEEDDSGPSHPPPGKTTAATKQSAELPPRQTDQDISKTHKFGRRMKDKLTSSTHEQREAERRKRAEEERKAYEQHLVIRRAMSKALETGQPQLIGKDKQGQDVYLQPPKYSGGYSNGYGVDPYGRGPYSGYNQRYMSPAGNYGRPYGYGYGGGYGLPLMGGLAGGMLMGSMLGGGMGMGMGGFGGGGL